MTSTTESDVASASRGELAGAGAPEQTRARYPDAEGYVERDGMRVFYEVYGEGERTALLLPTWSIVASRAWKMQIPYLARHCRVVAFDGRGNGRSDRPVGAKAYSIDEFAGDALAVMDATATERATLVAMSCGALWGTVVAADHPDRVDAIAYLGPAVSLAPNHPERDEFPLDEPLDTDEGWAKYNTHYWRRDYLDFLEFFFAQCFNEPHSTKLVEDCIGWGLQTTPEALADATRGIGVPRREAFVAAVARVRCPTVVIHGDRDLIRPHAQGEALAKATGGVLVTLEDSGHLPNARDPVPVNVLLRELISPPAPPSRWRRAGSRTRRALYISSPIGLGHARRDVAIATELRRLRPDLEIDWLAQHPVTEVLEAAGERIHPASASLAGECAHIGSEARDHELNVFEALRRMDEILLSNFMVFDDVVREEQYDLWIGDEAWEVDHFLHENPERKTAPFVWLTDFVGWLPMAEGGEREAALTADYNAEMLEHIARYPRVRDRSVFIGEPEDVVPGTFGPGLPSIREWTEAHFRFTGYVTGFDTAALPVRGALRRQLGYEPDEQVCVVTVGGSGVGEHLLRRVIASLPEARRLMPRLRMVVVAGPRIDAAALPAADGLEIRPYVHDLYLHLAASDVAVVQGGLATTMELTANRRPFIYFPLERHFEQNLHVRHRLDRLGAGRRMEYRNSPPETIAQAIAGEIGRPVDYRPVPTDGAARAAAVIAELF
ncbi:MAG TPA: alpha/beta fold hydrolase [Solirubrobacteraceae bacterium]